MYQRFSRPPRNAAPGKGDRDAPGDIFSMLVIMTLVGTFMAPPLVRWLMRGQTRLAPPLGEPSVTRATT